MIQFNASALWIKIGQASVSILFGIGILELQRWFYTQKLATSLENSKNHIDTSVLVTVGSTSKIKVSAVKNVIRKTFPGATIVGIDADSQVNNQPVGHEETRRGARNRLKDAINHMENVQFDDRIGQMRYAVAVENGIIETEPNVWVDLAWIVFYDCTSKVESWSCSAGVIIPDEIMQLLGGDTVAGKVIKQKIGKGMGSSRDPHELLTCHMTNREQILTEALMICWGTLKLNNSLLRA